MKFKHFIMTRYAVRQDGPELRVQITPDWFPDRIKLFEKTLQSVRRQIEQNFEWLIFYSPEYAADMMPVLELVARDPMIHMWPVEKGSFKNFNEEMREAANFYLTDETHVITTRLDNDDEIAPDFIKLVQEQFNGQDLTFVNFSEGVNRINGVLVPHPHLHNMFISVIEKREGAQTIFTWAHNTTPEIGPIIQLKEKGRWIHNCHPRQVWT